MSEQELWLLREREMAIQQYLEVYDRRRLNHWGRFLMWLLRKTT